ncbi:MAG: hypothetical protein ACOC35_02885 [Promethearchaeia archaeon]
MSLVGLSEIQILRGTISLIFVIISILIGIRMVLRYFTYKRKQLATIGLTWIFLSSAWWGGAFSFLSYLLFDYTFEPQLYLFIGNFFIPVALITWIYSFVTLAYPEYKKKLFYPYTIISLGFMVFIVVALFTDYTLIGELENKLNSTHSDISLAFIIFTLVSTLVTGIVFAKQSLSSENPTIVWKGRFLLLAFLVFIPGALLDAIVPPIPILLVLIKVLLMIGGVLYNFGFFLPKMIKNKLE